MRKITILLFILININFVNAQNLVVGFTDPNEILNLNSGSYAYDTVFLINNATLNITNQTQFIVNDVLATTGTSDLNVSNSLFEVNELFISKDSSTVHLSDTLTLACKIYVSNYSILNIDSATVSIPMTFKSELGWFGFNNSLFEITNSDFNLGTGALDGSFTDSANFIQTNNQFLSTMLPMTLGLAGNSVIIIDSCFGGMEFVIAENEDVTIQNSNFFMIWYTFSDGDTANYDYPPANSILIPGSSNITGSYQFSAVLPNVSGLDLDVSIQNTDGVYWGIISKKNSNVIVNNSSILACGFYFDGTTRDTASGFIDAQFYPSYSSPFLDRGFSINNTSVNAWNFYQSDTSEIIIDSCIYGESLGFGNGVTKLYNSTCDGTGGYLGGMDNSKTYVYSSQIIRQNGTAQIVNFKDSSIAWFYNSTITGNIVVSNDVQLFFGNTTFTSSPITNNNAYFAEVWIDTINNASINSTVSITGKVWGINGPSNNSMITRYVVEYSLPDSTGLTLITDSSAASFNIINNTLSNWNTQSLSVGNYLVWVTIYVDGDTAISCRREIFLDNNTGVNEEKDSRNISIYPNPATKQLTIQSASKIKSIKIYNLFGRLIKTVFSNNTLSQTINIENLTSGLYIVNVTSEKGNSKLKFIKE